MNLRTTIAIGAALLFLAGTSDAAFYQDKQLPNTGSGPLGLCVGPDGWAWFTQYAGNRIGAYDRITNTVRQWDLPTANSQPMEIVAGPDGALWFTEYAVSRIGRITTSGQLTELSLPTPGSGPSGIAVGPDGNLWVTEYLAGRIARVNPATSAIDEFPVGIGPAGLTSGPDGNLWMTLYDGNAIVRVTTSGEVTTFPLPFAASFPNAICAGADGALWFLQTRRNSLGRVTTSGAISEFSLPTPSAGLHGIAAGPDGSIWFTESSLSRVGRRLPTGEIVEHPLLRTVSFPRGLAITGSSVIHVAEQEGNAIGTFDFRDRLTLFNVSGSSPSATGGIVTGSDGNLWFGISRTEVGRISPAGSVHRFQLPWSVDSDRIRCFRLGPNGNVWFTYGQSYYQGGGIAEIDGDGAVTSHDLPESPESITIASDGHVWFTLPYVGFGLGRLDPFVGSVAYPLSVQEGPHTLTSVAGGDIWFLAADETVGRVTPAGQAASVALPSGSYPTRAIGTGPDGNIWYSRGDLQVGRVTPAFLVTQIQTPYWGGGVAIVPGSDGNLWTTAHGGLLRVTPGLEVTYLALPVPSAGGYGWALTGLTPGPNGALWFTDSNLDVIGRFATTAEQPTSFHTLVSCRVLDTRNPVGPLGGPAVAAHSTRVITVTNTCGVPADAVAISANVTVVPGSAGGYLGLFPGDGVPTETSTVSFRAGVVRANNAMAGLARDGTGRLGILNDSGDAVHVIVDVNGVFR